MFRILRVLDENIRVLPVLILAAAGLVSLKSVDLWDRFQSELLGITAAQAVESGASSESGTHEAEEVDEDTAWVADGEDTYYDEAGIGLSLAEVQVLESLSERREALDQREHDLVMRERLIEAAERRVEERINDLRALQARIEDLLLMRDEEEEAQIASLVSVYENMRAKDAARIFESLEESILVEVASRMREQRIALILAEMEPRAAQELTVQLATRLEMPGTQ